MRSKEERLKEIKEVIDAAGLLLKEGHQTSAMILLAQAVEVSGSLYDNKPGAARDQGWKRFDTAIHKLFPVNYHPFSQKLYKQWRCHTVHSLIPGKYIQFTGDREKHLVSDQDDVLYIHPGQFLADFAKSF